MANPLDFTHVFEPASAPDRPTLLMLHGTGGNEHDLVAAGYALSPGSAILSPRGKVLERGMPRFFKRLAEGVFDVEDLKFRAVELAAFVAAAATHYGFDPARVIAAGFSNGANIGSSVLLLSPRTLIGAMLFSPMVPFEPDPLPDLSGVSVFISTGRRDPTIPPNHTARLSALLESAAADVHVRWTDAGHSLGREDIDAAAEWLRQREL